VLIVAPGFPDLLPARTLQAKSARTKFVVETLLAHANQAQAALRRELAARKLDFFPLWINNMIWVKNASRADLLWLASRADVAQVDLDVKVRGIEPDDSPMTTDDPQSSTPDPVGGNHQSSIEWGVQRVNAPQAWAMGYTGQGVVVANLDTGVRWDHDALKPHYRGWNGVTATHDFNWFDPVGLSATPLDDNRHGTHTTGTAIGDDGAGNQIGVAPGAQWIACRNMNGGIGSVALYSACFQFALAPSDVSGSNPDPGKSADITSNSWACDASFGEVGCNVPSALVTATQTLRDAGVMVVAAAGNEGAFGCSTVKNAPATLDQAFSVGATDSADKIAYFSSRGPSTFTSKLKPDLVAPGVGVRSATHTATNSYSLLSGTSMAAPHVAGVVALLWSAAPHLRGNVDETEAILRATSRPLIASETCGGVAGSSVPNNTYGYGLIDAHEAIAGALSFPRSEAPAVAQIFQPITFTLRVTNAGTIARMNVAVTSSLPISTALISISPPGLQNGDSAVWQFASLPPSSTQTMSFVVSASQPGLIGNDVVQITYKGINAPVPGRSAYTLVSAQQSYWPIMAR
jgi:uncharacterized repeat protein (TIGR01451 family)